MNRHISPFVQTDEETKRHQEDERIRKAKLEREFAIINLRIHEGDE